jgi:hypothetical protein
MPRSSSTRVVGCLIVGVLLLLGFAFVTAFTTSPGIDGKKSKAQLGCTGIAQAVEAYMSNPDNTKHEPPRTLNDLVQPPFGGPSFVRNGAQDLLDPWGNPYQMQLRKRSDGSQFILISTFAPDGTPISQCGIGPKMCLPRD